MTTDVQKYVVFVLDSSGTFSGTANTGTVNVQFTNLSYNDKFYLRLTSFNTIFTAPNVSPLRGNEVQVSDGNRIYTVILPTGSYSVGGINDLGTAVAKAINLAVSTVGGTLILTANFNAATNLYTVCLLERPNSGSCFTCQPLSTSRPSWASTPSTPSC